MSRVNSRKTGAPLRRRFLPRPRSAETLRGLLAAVSLLAAALSSPAASHADAYLSEDKVRYGADSYTVDYDREIVTAKGRAYFVKGGRSVYSDRIVIYYGRSEKRALFSGNVLVKDQEGAYRVTGERGESRLTRDYYRIEGNAALESGARVVRASAIERREDGELLFTGDVRYTDPRYDVSAPLLRVQGGSALFEKGPAQAVEVLETASGSRVYCDSMRYDEMSGDLLFSGDALFLQGGGGSKPAGEADAGRKYGAAPGESASPRNSASIFVIRAGEIRYLREFDTFYLYGSVYAFDDSMSLSAQEAEYARAERVLSAKGGATLREGERTVSSSRVRIELDTRRVMLYGDAEGVF
jgi:lipopolysaccharide assembly outer membrane protein LptD (OstA)